MNGKIKEKNFANGFFFKKKLIVYIIIYVDFS